MSPAQQRWARPQGRSGGGGGERRSQVEYGGGGGGGIQQQQQQPQQQQQQQRYDDHDTRTRQEGTRTRTSAAQAQTQPGGESREELWRMFGQVDKRGRSSSLDPWSMRRSGAAHEHEKAGWLTTGRAGTGQLTEAELGRALVNGDYTSFDPHTVRMMIRCVCF